MRGYRLFGMLVCVIILAACSSSPIEKNMDREIHEFSAVNQNGKTINLPEDLKGSYWVADFIFTNCKTVCPPMTGNMARLQHQLNKENLNTQLISFSVDPENDTPGVLKQFANKYQADDNTWDFVTGYSFQDIKELSIKSFQSPLKKMDRSNQFAHGTSFFLITPKGEVIKRYKGTKATSTEQIIKDLKALK